MDFYRKYFDVNRVENQTTLEPAWGLTVMNIGHHIYGLDKKYPDPTHPSDYFFCWNKGRVLNEFQLVYIASGKGIFEADKVGQIPVEAGTVFLLFPGIWHRYKPVQEGWEEYWVGFSGFFAEHLMQQGCFRYESPLMYVGLSSEFLNIFTQLINTQKYEGIAFSQLSSCLTIQLLGLVYAASLHKERSNNRKELIVNRMRFEIHRHLSGNCNMEKLASQHNVSYIWFRKAFKEVVGESPGQYYLNLKIEKASQLLKDTRLSVSEIAFSTGFESEHHFSRIFKKKVKYSPSGYRESFKR
ncbi:AraC family transcriptional regulator [Mucilaginibacter sp. X4EP1]|uniref:AraC family transcriptional regulator n=1 Tax=Mucilaginibacter sp. X4EP1 TaxID=2723092 RepID=UPI00216A01B6|nr:AraC family transcriptional regulator [Mucilaginibacter sp. X4EP1]MCS3811549.1 AraC-like DNA-binding protein [Mucilaginibacter sp. X4EP1]